MQTAGQVGAAARERTGSLVRVNRFVTGAPWPVPRGAAPSLWSRRWAVTV